MSSRPPRAWATRGASGCSASSSRLRCPLIMAGIRLAVVTTIGLATVASILGESFGGFGFFITEGLNRFFLTEIYVGAVLSIAMAFGADFLLVRLERLDDALGASSRRSALMGESSTGSWIRPTGRGPGASRSASSSTSPCAPRPSLPRRSSACRSGSTSGTPGGSRTPRSTSRTSAALCRRTRSS